VKEEKLTPKEQKVYAKRKAMFEKAYPYLKEAGMQVLLHQVVIIEILIERFEKKILGVSEEAGKDDFKNYQSLTRTYALLLTRMGISFVSRKRVKTKTRPKSPLQLLKEMEE